MKADPLEQGTQTPASESTAAQSTDRDLFDPLKWEVPVVCKDCDKEFKVPYRHFQAGVVFHCPHCHGSYVPTLPMYRKVHDTFEIFYSRLRCEFDEIARNSGQEHVNAERLEQRLTEFQEHLGQLARQLRPAGKMVRRKGLAAMFT